MINDTQGAVEPPQIFLDFSRIVELRLEESPEVPGAYPRVYRITIQIGRHAGEGTRSASVSGVLDAAEGLLLAFQIADRAFERAIVPEEKPPVVKQ